MPQSPLESAFNDVYNLPKGDNPNRAAYLGEPSIESALNHIYNFLDPAAPSRILSISFQKKRGPKGAPHPVEPSRINQSIFSNIYI